MKSTFFIIDGYNVLHTCGFASEKNSSRSLENARQRLLGFLQQRLTSEEKSRTVVVFDSSQTHLADSGHVNGILVLFATQYASADEMIEVLVRKHSAPQQLLVVSADHRIQLAAKRRGANSIDGLDWIEQLTQPTQTNSAAELQTETPEVEDRNRKLGKQEVEDWIKQLNAGRFDPTQPNLSERTEKRDSAGSKTSENDPSLPDVFPPGYADDLFDETDP